MIKLISNTELENLTHNATKSERQRAHLNVHDSLDANVQRLFIATEPDTYMRPHRHPEPHKWEFLTVLTGEIDLMVFDDNGTLTMRETLSQTGIRSVEIPPNTWHAYVCKLSKTSVLEVKEGAYIPTEPEDFAPWSPAENSAGAKTYLEWMRDATLGSKYK